MNYDYSIENSIEKIQNINTHTYFKEVYQTFVNGNTGCRSVIQNNSQLSYFNSTL